MNDPRIIFPNDQGGVAVVIPAPGVPFEIVVQAVPAGLPYKIVDVSDIPADRTFRDAWECDFSEPDGYGPEPTPVEESMPPIEPPTEEVQA